MNADSRPLLVVSLLLAAAVGGLMTTLLWPREVAAQSASSGSRYVAEVGPYQAGVSLLYVLDQETQRLAVYEARGGAPNSRKVVFVGARNIGLDTLLNAFNDESEYSYTDFAEEFEESGIPVPVFPQETTAGDGQ